MVLAAVAAFGLWLAGNVRTNADATGIPLTFDYLDQPAAITVPGNPFRATQSVQDAIGVGLVNTLRVSITGIVLATVLGTLIGIARLSTNWLLSTAARVYVELFRNVPLLVVILFAYLAVALRMPRVEDALHLDHVLVASVRGVVVPWARTDGQGFAVLALLAVAVVVAVLAFRWRRAVFDRTGTPAHAVLAALASFVAVTVVGHLLLGGPVDVTTPVLEDGRISGGITMAPEFSALLAALTLYTASHIAEIVRGSIQAVPKGQTEAATALALSSGQRMRLVVLPQALRIAVPAFANQYLNLTKNSSLAVAISYFELTKITQVTIANRSPAVPSYGLLLFVYLAISLALSAITNVVNRRLALVER